MNKKNNVSIEIWKTIAMSFPQNIESKRIFIVCYRAQILSPHFNLKMRHVYQLATNELLLKELN